MSNNSASSILSAISTTLQASPSLLPNTLRQIKLGRDMDHSGGFPYCRIYLLSFDNPVADTISYERTFTFAVEIWQESTNKSKQNAEQDFLAAIDGVLNRLSGTWQLGIGVEKSVLGATSIQSLQVNGGPMIVASIQFTVTTLIQNPS